MAIKQIGNNTLVGLETELPLTGGSGSFFMAENTSNLYGYYSAGTPTLISGATRSLQQVIDVNQNADKVQFILPGIVSKLSNGYINDAILLANNNFLFYGGFSGYNGTVKTKLCEIDLSGNIITSFSGSVNNGNPFRPSNILETPDGIYIACDFTLVNGVTANRIVRLAQDGSTDTAFNSGTGFNDYVGQISKDSNNKIIVTGRFTSYNGVPTISRIVRLNPDGSLDTTFNITGSTNTTVSTNTIDSLGRIYVTYYGNVFNGKSQSGLIRLLSDGSVDTSFNVGLGIDTPLNKVNRIAIDTAGRIYLYGAVIIYNGVTINRLVRLNENGSIDTTFNTGTGFNPENPTNAYGIYNITFFPDNSLLVYGEFTNYNGATVFRLVKIKVDGSLDTTFKFDPTNKYSPSIIKTIFVNDKIYLFGSSLLDYSGSTSNIVIVNYDGAILTSNLIYSGGKATYNVDRINNTSEFEILNKRVTREFIETYDITSPSNSIIIDTTIPTNTKLEVSNVILNDISSKENANNKVNVLTGTSNNYPSVTALNNTRIGSFGITIDGGGQTPTNGVKGYVTIPYDAVITGWDVIGNTTGNCVIDIWKSNSFPTPSDSITGTEKPRLNTQQINRDDNLTTWNTIINKNNIIAFNLESSSVLTKINLIIKLIKT